LHRESPQLLVADRKGKIYNIPFLGPSGMEAGLFSKLTAKDLIRLPRGSELFILPERIPVGFDKKTKTNLALDKNPYSKKGKDCFAVSAFISPGYTVTHHSPYIEKKHAKRLPLFSYAAVCFYKDDFYVAAKRVDRELRQDLRFMDMDKVRKNAKELKKLFKHNRLVSHLSRCALSYGCPAAKNLFLKRYEAPLPASPSCNSACIGCISYQPDERCSVTEPRIGFIPKPEEIAEVALYHIKDVKDPVVSFGQGCEGEPLMAGGVLESSIKLIRKDTKKGIINLNTNASKPEIIARLFDAGLDSIRVSINSAQNKYYTKYYKPKGYAFKDVISSIKKAKARNGFVSLNYLTFPGLTDSADELKNLKSLIEKTGINMLQLRNLNIDPIHYKKALKFSVEANELLGMRRVIALLRKEFPSIMTGYFNPSRGRIRRSKSKN
jgi:molybdenum cofactor biosynthesis enzyme MoaA